ncbi:MAG: hypothetical protein LBT47_13825 [Deltaproteobacteria bacterium]|jgi:DNA invertase Pin-like site-specific DNA recombinase|nr:hypothetical protein [Deltaproteobacteria bacterium]
MEQSKTTILYSRLSRDVELGGESTSITHQKQILENFAIKTGYRIGRTLLMTGGAERGGIDPTSSA